MVDLSQTEDQNSQHPTSTYFFLVIYDQLGYLVLSLARKTTHLSTSFIPVLNYVMLIDCFWILKIEKHMKVDPMILNMQYLTRKSLLGQ